MSDIKKCCVRCRFVFKVSVFILLWIYFYRAMRHSTTQGRQEKYVTVRVLIFPGHRRVDSDVALCTLSQIDLLMIGKIGLWQLPS